MKPIVCCLSAVALAVLVSCGAFAQEAADSAPNPALDRLSEEIHAWLAVNEPVSPQAYDRIDRPSGWAPDWSQTSLQQRKVEYLKLQGQLKALSTLGFDTADRIDAAMLGAALAKVHWQLEVLASPRRDPGFYIDQSLGSVFAVLARSPEPSEPDIDAIITRLRSFTGLINAARLNLDRVVPALAEAAIARLGDVDTRIEGLEAALAARVPESAQADFALGLRAARQSMVSFKDWLAVSEERFEEPPGVGAQRYQWYLGHVAMVPRSPEAIRAGAEMTLARAGARLAVLRHRNPPQAGDTALDSAQRVVQMAQISGTELAAFVGNAGLMELPAALPPFELSTFPAPLAALTGIGEAVTFSLVSGGAGRRYIHEDPGATGYLEGLAWTDPRLLLTWDGTPGRHGQFHLAAGHDRPVRRRAIGASLSEGIASYFQQQVAEAGLFAFSPSSAQAVLEWLAVQAALAVVDVDMAQGFSGVDEAVETLVDTTGLSRARAEDAVQFLVAHPGHAGAAFAAYGQVIDFLADASRIRREDFSLPGFNDRLLRNANVPIALQRWEYLGLEDELDELVEQRGRPATVPE